MMSNMRRLIANWSGRALMSSRHPPPAGPGLAPCHPDVVTIDLMMPGGRTHSGPKNTDLDLRPSVAGLTVGGQEDLIAPEMGATAVLKLSASKS
jgi:hypothetical protein